MIVRKAEREDYSQIKQLFNEQYSEIQNEYIFKDLTKSIKEEEFNENLKTNSVYMKVVEDENSVVGFAIGFLRKIQEDENVKQSTLGILYNIIVERAHRRKGIGSKLLEDFELWC